VIRALLAERPSMLPPEGQVKYGEALALAKMHRPEPLDLLRFAVRLHALELRYHEVGGLHDQLVAAGRFDHVALGPADVERATLEPPSGGRAAVRGACVKTHRQPGWVCDWRYLFHNPSGTFVDLRDPFDARMKTVTREQFGATEDADLDLLETFTRLTARR
jgi:hypothetical protein